MRFEFATAGRIVFGAGTAREIVPAAKEMGQRALLVAGRSRRPPLEDFAHELFTVEYEPTVELVRRGVQIARESRCDMVIGFGGGSAIDAGKAIAAMLTNSGEPLDYLEVIGKGLSISAPSAPFIAVPTTAGTGAEVTRNAAGRAGMPRDPAGLAAPGRWHGQCSERE